MSQFKISKDSAFLPKSEQIQGTEDLISTILDLLEQNSDLSNTFMKTQQLPQDFDEILSTTHQILSKFFTKKDLKFLFQHKFSSFSSSLNDFLTNQIIALDSSIADLQDVETLQMKNQFQEIAENVVYGNFIYLQILFQMDKTQQELVYGFLDKKQIQKIKFAVVSLQMAENKPAQLIASVEYLTEGIVRRNVWDYRKV